MPARKIPMADRLASKSRRIGDCLVWQGALTAGGYGITSVGRTNAMAHRVAYETHVGPIPNGLVIDHLCRNRACINPAHLEPVTYLENQLRGASHQKTHCKNGHLFDDANTYRVGNERRCRACGRQRSAKSTAKKKAFSAERGVVFREREAA